MQVVRPGVNLYLYPGVQSTLWNNDITLVRYATMFCKIQICSSCSARSASVLHNTVPVVVRQNYGTPVLPTAAVIHVLSTGTCTRGTDDMTLEVQHCSALLLQGNVVFVCMFNDLKHTNSMFGVRSECTLTQKKYSTSKLREPSIPCTQIWPNYRQYILLKGDWAIVSIFQESYLLMWQVVIRCSPSHIQEQYAKTSRLLQDAVSN